MNDRNGIATVPFFARLDEAERALLTSRLIERTFERGQQIFAQEDPGHSLYIIVSGQVRIFTLNEQGQELALTLLGDGEFFGELALLDGLPRAASAQTIVRTTTLMLHRDDFLATIRTCPPVAAAILEELAARLRRSNSYAEQLIGMPATQRVVRRLTEIAERRRSGAASSVVLRLTQEDLASLAGTSRETVNRALADLRDAGLVRIERRQITVLDIAALWRYTS